MALARTEAAAARAVVGRDGAAFQEFLVAGGAEVVVAAVALVAVVPGGVGRDRVGAVVAVGGDCEGGVFGGVGAADAADVGGVGDAAAGVGERKGSRRFRMEGGC